LKGKPDDLHNSFISFHIESGDSILLICYR